MFKDKQQAMNDVNESDKEENEEVEDTHNNVKSSGVYEIN
jgi:hypothetical protein